MMISGIVLVVLIVLLAQDFESSSSTSKFDVRVCDKCPPGTFLVEHCKDGERKSQCKECPEGTYSETENTVTSCQACREYCPQRTIFKASCTSTTDNQCECPEGYKNLINEGEYDDTCVKGTTTVSSKPLDYSTTTQAPGRSGAKGGSSTKLTVPIVLILCLAVYVVYR